METPMIGNPPGFRPLLFATAILAAVPLPSALARSHPPGCHPRCLGLGGRPGGRWQQRRRASAQAQEHPGDDPGRHRRAPLRGQDDPIGGARTCRKPATSRLRRVTVSGVGAEWFEGTGSGYAVQPGRRDVPTPAASRLALVDRRGRPTARRSWAMAARPGAWPTPRRPIATAGRACRSTLGSWRPGWPASATASSCSTTPARSGPGRARRSPSGSSPTGSSTAGSRTARAPRISRSSPAPTIAARRRRRAACASSRDDPAAGRRGPGLVGHAPRRGPAGTLGFFAELGGRALPRELVPIAGEPARGSRCTCAT